MTENIVTEKTCNKCGVTKPLTDFTTHKEGKFGRRGDCRICQQAAVNRERKRESKLAWERTERGREWAREYRKTYKDKVPFYPSRSSQEGKDTRRDRHLRRTFGISLSQYNAMAERQGGVCAICLKPPRSRRLAVDHCHASGRVRGLLCVHCNTALGGFKDDLENLDRAKHYLLSHLT